MIRASDLIGCELRTESGERLGRVHDLRVVRASDDWRLEGLVLGRRGMATRLVGTGPEPRISGGVVAWEAVSRLEDGLIVVRDGTTAADGDAHSPQGPSRP
jgi:sporulation protein YlmC with PRC-barrel domain